MKGRFHFFCQVSVQPTNLIFLDGYYKNPTAPRKIEIPDDEGVGGNKPDLGFSHSLDYLEPAPSKEGGNRAKGPKRPLLKKRLPARGKGIGQTLTDIFFPNLSPKRFFKPRLPLEEPRRKMLMFTTPRPILTTLRAIQEKFPSILVDPFNSMRGMKKDVLVGGRRREDEEEKTKDNFPYKFQRPVPLPDIIETPEEAGKAVDRELLHPG